MIITESACDGEHAVVENNELALQISDDSEEVVEETECEEEEEIDEVLEVTTRSEDDGDYNEVTENGSDVEYDEQIVESIFELKEDPKTPEEYDREIRRLIPLVYKDQNVDADAMIRRSPVQSELYAYLKQMYWYNKHTGNVEDEEQEKGNKEENTGRTMSVMEMFARRALGVQTNEENEEEIFEDSGPEEQNVVEDPKEENILDYSFVSIVSYEEEEDGENEQPIEPKSGRKMTTMELFARQLLLGEQPHDKGQIEAEEVVEALGAKEELVVEESEGKGSGEAAGQETTHSNSEKREENIQCIGSKEEVERVEDEKEEVANTRTGEPMTSMELLARQMLLGEQQLAEEEENKVVQASDDEVDQVIEYSEVEEGEDLHQEMAAKKPSQEVETSMECAPSLDTCSSKALAFWLLHCRFRNEHDVKAFLLGAVSSLPNAQESSEKGTNRLISEMDTSLREKVT